MVRMVIKGGGHLAISGASYPVYNPATGEVVDQAPQGDARDVEAAVQSAEGAFDRWWDTPAARRGELVAAGARRILEREQELARLLTSEQGKPLREAILEVRRLAHTLDHYAGLSKNLRGGYVPSLDDGKYGLILKRPIGVVGSIVPWNFPISLMGNKIAPALVAGNTVIVKPASTTPLTAIRCIELLNQAGLPPGVLNIVTGPGSTVGEAILTHAKIRKIGFTGATATGRHVMAIAAETIKRVTLELGGSDPLIVCDDANLEAAASATSVGRFFNCGQACLAVKRVFVFEKVADEFTDKVVARAKKLRVGNGLEKGVLIGPMHSQGQRAEVESQIEQARAQGAELLLGGGRPEGDGMEKGNYLLPTILTNIAPDSRLLREEVFGPALPIVRVHDLEEAIARANDSIYGLGSSIWTASLERATQAAEKLEAGYTWINSPQVIYDELPFGGFKQSGVGKEHGIEALDHYMESKAVVVGAIPSSKERGYRGE